MPCNCSPACSHVGRVEQILRAAQNDRNGALAFKTLALEHLAQFLPIAGEKADLAAEGD